VSAASNPLWPTLDTFRVDLTARGAPGAIGQLVASLARHREQMAPDAWKASCAALDRHPAVRQLLEDPYSRDARTKPSGYAGDARTLDYVYRQDPGSQAITTLGRELFDVTTGVPVAAAVRDRCDALAAEIRRRASQKVMTVASIACGHARELDRIPEDTRQRIRFWGIDQDARSIEYCRSRHDTLPAAFEVSSVRDLISRRVRIPPSDLVYASGLFDYLDRRTGAVLVRRMLASLDVGGSVIVPNLTPYNQEIGYMEAVMDWWMCYRSEADMALLVDLPSLGPYFRAMTLLESKNRIAYLRIDRVE